MNGSPQLKVQQDMGSVNIDSAGMFEKTTIPVVQYTLRKKDDNITKLRKSGRVGVKVILFAQYLFSFSLRTGICKSLVMFIHRVTMKCFRILDFLKI